VTLALAIKSLRNRSFTASLTVLSIALAVALVLGVERIRHQARDGFANTVSGTDLIVGARTSPVNLLLFSVFRIGNASNNISWSSYRTVAERPEVAWSIPLSLGDSHRGFRVLGTTHEYFEHFRFAGDHTLELARGTEFEKPHDAVLGAQVAQTLGYELGTQFVIAHGSGEVELSLHKDKPFRVVGVLARTGTPVDRAIHVPLAGIDAIHAPETAAAQDPLAAAVQSAGAKHHAHGAGHDHADRGHSADVPNQPISAFLVGLKSRGQALSIQRLVSEYPSEPLTAILPGVALLEVWETVAAAERTLLIVSVLVVVVGLAGMLVALLTGLNERRREMAVLRSVGARPSHVFGLIMGEAVFLTLLGIALGVAALYIALLAGQPWLESRLGLFFGLGWPSLHEFGIIALVGAAGALVGLVPAYRIYRFSLADGMTLRI
jgi:putative ABC transport system permease protein